MMNTATQPYSSFITHHSSFLSLSRLDLRDELHLCADFEGAGFDGRGRGRLAGHGDVAGLAFVEGDGRAEGSGLLHLDDADDAAAERIGDGARLRHRLARGLGE